MHRTIVFLVAAATAAVLGALPASARVLAATGALTEYPRLQHPLRRRTFATAGGGPADEPCPYHPATTPFDGPLPTGVADAVAATVAQLTASLNATSVPGASYDLRYGAQVLSRAGLGTADRSSGAPVSVNTLFRIGSVTKSFVAVLAFRAASLGLLSLDDPVARHAPAFAVRDPFGGRGGADITFRHLLTQRSGLQREAPFGVADTSAALAAVAQTYLIGPPGGPPSYSNLGFALLGHVLAEFVFGNASSLEALLAQHVTGPLGLSDTGTEYTPAVLARLAPSYDGAGRRVPFADLGWVWPAGSMYASAQNLSAFGATLIDAAADGAPADGGPLGIAPALARELLDVTVLLRDGVSLVSAPWESFFADSYVVRSKGGNVEAYSTTLTLVPELRLALAVSWNGGVDEGAAAAAATAVLIPALAAALTAAEPPPSQGPAPQEFEGTYQAVPPGAAPDATVLVQGPYLMLVVPGFLSAPLAYAGPAVPDAYRVFLPPNALTCVGAFELAIGGEYALFGRDPASGRVVAVAMPGWVPGVSWARA